MTRNRNFKDLVRARVDKTGESYAAARRQLLASGPGARATATPGPAHFPGSIPAATALRIVLAAAGVRAPHTKQPFSEAMVFGLGGGIGAGVFAFHYAREDFSSFFVAGRHLWWDDLAWMKEACGRFGVAASIVESGGEKAAGKALIAAAGTGPVIAWVDKASLPYRAMPAWMRGGAYHLLAVLSVDAGNGTALLSDLADEPIEIVLADLTAARGRIKKDRNRLLTVTPEKSPLDLKAAVREAIASCAQGLVKQRMKNFTIESFRDWGSKMGAKGGKDSWEVQFPPGPNLWRGLVGIFDFVEGWGTGGGLARPIMAEFLEEAAGAMGDRGLLRAAEMYSALGRDWSALAREALPDSVPAMKSARELAAKRSELFASEGAAATETLSGLWRRGEELGRRAGEAFPLPPEAVAALRGRLASAIVELHRRECEAQAALVKLAAARPR